MQVVAHKHSDLLGLRWDLPWNRPRTTLECRETAPYAREWWNCDPAEPSRQPKSSVQDPCLRTLLEQGAERCEISTRRNSKSEGRPVRKSSSFLGAEEDCGAAEGEMGKDKGARKRQIATRRCLPTGRSRSECMPRSVQACRGDPSCPSPPLCECR